MAKEARNEAESVQHIEVIAKSLHPLYSLLVVVVQYAPFKEKEGH